MAISNSFQCSFFFPNISPLTKFNQNRMKNQKLDKIWFWSTLVVEPCPVFSASLFTCPLPLNASLKPLPRPVDGVRWTGLILLTYFPNFNASMLYSFPVFLPLTYFPSFFSSLILCIPAFSDMSCSVLLSCFLSFCTSYLVYFRPYFPLSFFLTSLLPGEAAVLPFVPPFSLNSISTDTK